MLIISLAVNSFLVYTFLMDTKYSIASKARWAKLSPEMRSEKMRELAVKKWQKTSIKKRKEHSKFMQEIRLKK